MLELISDVISYKDGKLRDDGDSVTAEEILEIIENEGMKPPHHPKKYGSYWCNHVNWDTDVYDWEEE